MATRSQDDDKRLCLVDDLKEVQVHIQVKPIRTSSSLNNTKENMTQTRGDMILVTTKTKDIFPNYVDPCLYNIGDFTSQELIVLNNNLLLMTDASDNTLSFDLNEEFDVIGRRRIGLKRTTRWNTKWQVVK
ncbi:hypothetical protein Tco_1459344 [Tanacetum coccineum]